MFILIITEGGDRPAVNDYILLITDGFPTRDIALLPETIRQIRAQNIMMIGKGYVGQHLTRMRMLI